MVATGVARAASADDASVTIRPGVGQTG